MHLISQLKPHNGLIYKYRSINKNTFNLLRNNEFYYSFPHEFNDPFDIFTPPPDFNDFSEGQWYQLVKDGYEPLSWENEIIVCCFSAVKDNILMWSHYAEKHTGICLGFEVINNDEKKYLLMNEELGLSGFDHLPIWEVSYENKMPGRYISFINDNKGRFSGGLYDDLLREFFTTKAKAWRYEREYRSMFSYNQHKRRTFKFYKEILREVIFGIKIKDDARNNIIDLVKTLYIGMGIPVELIQARQSKTKYKIDFERITI
jgi:hypothetical protein